MPALTTTSYAVLGLLAIRPWTTYELAQQMERSMRFMWPRAQSKLYEEPKKLVEHGLAQATKDAVGRRQRTIYSITPEGRDALSRWLGTPGEGPVLEFEQLLKVFFAEHASSTTDVLENVRATRAWAEACRAISIAIARDNLEAGGRFPARLPQTILVGTFLTDFFAMTHRWAEWAEGVIEQWPDDPGQAAPDLATLEEIVNRETARNRESVT